MKAKELWNAFHITFWMMMNLFKIWSIHERNGPIQLDQHLNYWNFHISNIFVEFKMVSIRLNDVCLCLRILGKIFSHQTKQKAQHRQDTYSKAITPANHPKIRNLMYFAFEMQRLYFNDFLAFTQTHNTQPFAVMSNSFLLYFLKLVKRCTRNDFWKCIEITSSIIANSNELRFPFSFHYIYRNHCKFV